MIWPREARKLKVGAMVTLMNHDFRVSGIVVHGKGARFFVPLATAQDIAGAAKRVSMIYVRSTGDTEAVRAEMVKRFPDYRIRSMAEYLSLMTSSSLPGLTPFIRSFVGLGVAISFLVILLTMYTLVLERRREIGILKALGASRLEICWLIVAEALRVGGAWRGVRNCWPPTAPRRYCIAPRPRCRFKSPPSGSRVPSWWRLPELWRVRPIPLCERPEPILWTRWPTSKREQTVHVAQIRCSRDANLVQTHDARINRAPWRVSREGDEMRTLRNLGLLAVRDAGGRLACRFADDGEHAQYARRVESGGRVRAPPTKWTPKRARPSWKLRSSAKRT